MPTCVCWFLLEIVEFHLAELRVLALAVILGQDRGEGERERVRERERGRRMDKAASPARCH